MSRGDINITVNATGAETVDRVTRSVEELNIASETTRDNLESLSSGTSVFGEIKSRVQGAIQSVRAFANSFRTVQGAIAATGIGALLIAVTSLIAYFKNTEKGARTLAIATTALGIITDKLSQVFAKLGTLIVDVFTNPKEYIEDFKALIKTNITNRIEGLIELFPKLGEAIQLTFSGNFKAASKVAADALIKVGAGVENGTDKILDLGVAAKETFIELKNDVIKSVETATMLVDGLEALRKQINSVKVENAELNRTLELQKQIGEDTTKDYDVRRTALLKAGEAQLAIAKNSARQATLELVLLELQKQTTSNIEERRALEETIGDARAAQIEAQTAYEVELQDVKKVTRELDLEELERTNTLKNLILDSRKEISDNKFLEAQKELDNAQRDALVEATVLKASLEEKQLIINGFDEQRKAIRSDFLDEINAIEQAKAINQFDILKNKSNEYYASEVTKLENALAANIITEQEFNDLKVKIESDNADRLLQIDKDKEANSYKILTEYSTKSIDLKKSEFDKLRDEINDYYNKKNDSLLIHLETELITNKQYNDALLALEKEQAEKLADVKEQERQGNIKRGVENAELAINSAQLVADAVIAISDSQVASIERKNREEQTNLEKKLNSGLISQVEFDKQKIILENQANVEADKVKKKAFIANKAMNIANATIDTFKGASAAFSSLAAIPVVGVPLGIAAAAAATAAGLANIRSIAQTKFEPTQLSQTPSAPSTQASTGTTIGGDLNVSQAPVPPTVSLFGSANGSGNENNSNTLGTNQVPVRAYVVESDITTTQANVLQYQQRSEIG